MSLSTLLSPLFALAAVWVFIHLALRIFLPHASRVPLSYQPPPFSASRILLTERVLFICFRTTRVNTYADRLEAWLTRRGRKHVARAVYALGGTLAAGGLLAAVAVLGWTVTKMASEVIRRWASASTAEGLADDVIRVWKREDPEVLAAVPAVQQAGYGIPVYAIIPGVTVPLSHLPLLLVALLSSQIFHEFGHFITAALEDITVMSVGLSVTIVFPSAFVALSQGALRELPAPARLRIASAGAFHNLLLYLLFSVLARMPLPSVLGYRDVSSWGRVISRIQPGSPLEGHLPLGSIVTKIDDDMLSSVTADHPNEPGFDAWSALLSRPDTLSDLSESEAGWLGWCVERAWFEDQATACCASSSDIHRATPESCFVAYPPFALSRCVDPLPYLGTDADVPSHARCASAVDCGAESVCVRPRSDQSLLRITIHLPSWASPDGQPTDRTVVWSGPRYEILEEVEVTTYTPRLTFLPLTLPAFLTALNSYFIALNLSLFLFNLLPLAFLDGAPVFSALFDIAVHGLSAVPGDVESGSYLSMQDPELMTVGRCANKPTHRWIAYPDGRVKWKRRLERALHLLSAGLVSACIVFGTLLSISAA